MSDKQLKWILLTVLAIVFGPVLLVFLYTACAVLFSIVMSCVA